MELKKKLITSPILILPRFHLDFILDADASGDGLGAVLSQVVDGREHVVAYASRVLSRTEKKYCATRREMLALVWATCHFRPYLYGKPFTLRTDHNSLKWLHNFKEPEGQVARWLELLSEFQYQVIHRPGMQHINADSLSRRPRPQCGMTTSEGVEVVVESNATTEAMATTENSLLPTWTIEEIRNFQNADTDIKQVVQWMESDSIPSRCPEMASSSVRTLWNQRKQLVLEPNGVLFRKWKDILGGGMQPRLQLVVPAMLAPDILSGLHDSPIGGHMGVKKTLEKVRSRFYWPGQRHYVYNCYLCASRKSPAKARAPLQVTDSVSRPF